MNGPLPLSSRWPRPDSLWRGKSVSWLAITAICFGFVWLFENYRGLRAVQVEIDLLEASGVSLRWDPELLAGPVPDEENFGAAPCLRGITVEIGEYSSGAQPEWQDIPGMEGLRFGGLQILLDWDLNSRYLREQAKPRPKYWTLAMLPVRSESPDWSQWRHSMMFSGYFPMITDDVPDEWAVLRGLDKLEPVFAQLAAAALRPHAVFLPAPRERFHDWPPELDDADRAGSRLERLSDLITLRGRAAIVCGDGAEAARMLRILLRLNDAANNEFGSYRFRKIGDYLFTIGLQLHIWDSAALDEFTAALTFDTRTWMLHDVRLMTLYDGLDRMTIGKHWFNRFVRQDLPWFMPQGWADHGRALKLSIYRTEMLEPLKARGMAGLVGGQESFQRLNQGLWAPLRKGPLGMYDARPTNGYLFSEMKRRIVIVAAAVEKVRLQRRRFPESHQDIPLPGPANHWLDLDGQPIRYTRSQDGTRVAIYSIGINLKDDWRGEPPPKPDDVNAAPKPQKPGSANPETSSAEGIPPEPVPPRTIAVGYRDEDWVLVLRLP